MHRHKPIFFVFAGNNGSGKSTLRSLIIDYSNHKADYSY